MRSTLLKKEKKDSTGFHAACPRIGNIPLPLVITPPLAYQTPGPVMVVAIPAGTVMVDTAVCVLETYRGGEDEVVLFI